MFETRGGGRLQLVLMRPTPQLSFKTWGGGEGQLGGRGVPPGGWGGGLAGGPGGGVWQGVGGGSSRGSWGHPARGEGGGVRVRARGVTDTLAPRTLRSAPTGIRTDAASLPVRGVTDTLAPRTLRSAPTGIRTEHL